MSRRVLSFLLAFGLPLGQSAPALANARATAAPGVVLAPSPVPPGLNVSRPMLDILTASLAAPPALGLPEGARLLADPTAGLPALPPAVLSLKPEEHQALAMFLLRANSLGLRAPALGLGLTPAPADALAVALPEPRILGVGQVESPLFSPSAVLTSALGVLRGIPDVRELDQAGFEAALRKMWDNMPVPQVPSSGPSFTLETTLPAAPAAGSSPFLVSAFAPELVLWMQARAAALDKKGADIVDRLYGDAAARVMDADKRVDPSRGEMSGVHLDPATGLFLPGRPFGLRALDVILEMQGLEAPLPLRPWLLARMEDKKARGVDFESLNAAAVALNYAIERANAERERPLPRFDPFAGVEVLLDVRDGAYLSNVEYPRKIARILKKAGDLPNLRGAGAFLHSGRIFVFPSALRAASAPLAASGLLRLQLIRAGLDPKEADRLSAELAKDAFQFRSLSTDLEALAGKIRRQAAASAGIKDEKPAAEPEPERAEEEPAPPPAPAKRDFTRLRAGIRLAAIYSPVLILGAYLVGRAVALGQAPSTVEVFLTLVLAQISAVIHVALVILRRYGQQLGVVQVFQQAAETRAHSYDPKTLAVEALHTYGNGKKAKNLELVLRDGKGWEVLLGMTMPGKRGGAVLTMIWQKADEPEAESWFLQIVPDSSYDPSDREEIGVSEFRRRHLPDIDQALARYRAPGMDPTALKLGMDAEEFMKLFRKGLRNINGEDGEPAAP